MSPFPVPASSVRALAWWGGLLALVGCRPPPTQSPNPDPVPAAETHADPTVPASAPASPCGPVGMAFEDHAWAPANAPAVASLRVDDPQLPAALAALGAHTRAPGHGLPIPLALSLGQWTWQVPLVRSTLQSAGFEPAELLFVASDDAAHAWVWRSECDIDDAIARVEAAWSVEIRRTVDAVVGTAPPATEQGPAFPYDVLMLPGDRMALVPAGRGSSALARFSAAAPVGLGAGSPMTAGRRLDELAPAPVRLVVQGLALVEASATTAPTDPHLLRVTGQGVERPPEAGDDASVSPSP